MNQSIIAASILSADFSKLGDECRAVLAAGADQIHFDVMDHHFVPNLSFGAVVCQSLRKAGIDAPIDAHLMVTNPEDFIEEFAKAGANCLTFHAEVVKNPIDCVKKIHDAGMQAGIAINPDTPFDLPSALLSELHMVLLMSVYPGFGGQSFIESSIEKIQTARQKINAENPSVLLGIDGGIKVDNIERVAKAGANFFVLGSGLFKAADYGEIVRQVREKIA